MKTSNRSKFTIRNRPRRADGIAILAAAALLAPRPGLAQTGPGYALSFDGVANRVEVNAQNVPIANSTYTIEAWIKPNSMGNYGIVGWGNYGVTNQVNSLSLRTNGLVNSWWGNDLAVTNTGLAGTWHHVAATFDGTWRKLYLDGVLVASNSPAGHNVTTRNNLTIGRVSTADYFNGLIDEVRVWGEDRNQLQIQTNRFASLSGSESGLNAYWRLDEGTGSNAADSAGPWNPGILVGIPTWMRSTAPFKPEAATTNTTSITTASGQLNAKVHAGNLPAKAWFQWGATVNYGTNTPQISVGPALPVDPNTLAFDVSSVLTNLAVNTTYYYRAVVTNGVGTNYGAQRSFTTSLLPTGPGCALTFDGVDDCVEFNRPVADDFTLECWFRSTQMAGDATQWWQGRSLVDGEVPGLVGDFGLSLGAGKVLFGTGGTSDTTIRSEQTFADGNWHHVAATRQRSSGSMLLYVDGVLVASGTGSTVALNAPVALRLGSLAPGLNSFQGMLDEVRVWNTVRSQTQIQGNLGRPLAGNEPGLAAYLRLDECSETSTADITGHGFQGTLLNGTVWTNSTVPYGPFVLTHAATNLTTTAAALRGSVNPEGFVATAWFEWGTNTSYGNTTLVTNVGPGINTVALSTNVGILPSFATYHFRAAAANVYGTNHGEDFTFWMGPPIVSTLPTTDIATNAVTLRGASIPSGPSAQAWFQWGPTTNYGNSTVLVSIGSGTLPATITNRLSGLMPGATYHYRVASSNTFGASYGEDMTFTNAFLAHVVSVAGSQQATAMAWGDFDLDGDLDLVTSGWADTRLFRNTAGVFAEVAVPFADVGYGSISVGDCNNDGWPDLLITGTIGSWGSTSQVWTNTGSGWSLMASPPSIPAVTDSSVHWGDFDNDGRADILLTGGGGGGGIVQVFQNTGGSFVLNTSLPGAYYSAAAWGDYDKDGWLDILVAGVVPDGTGTNYATRLYRNNGDRTFTLVPTTLPGVCMGQVEWGDFDNDGFLDILITGTGMSGNVSAIFRNNGNGGFTDINAGLVPLGQSAGVWGDFDNDGRLDVALTGQGLADAATLMYHNNGNGTFSIVPSAGLGANVSSYQTLAVADYDKDGRLDIAASGFGSSSHVYRNVWPGTNVPPTAPANLVATVLGTNALLSWSASSDSTTPAPGLSYNVRVGTAPGLSNLVSPLAAGNGWRRVPAIGNAQQNLSATLTGLKQGSNYYWSVQAIDTSFAGSPFECSGLFTVTPAPSSTAAQLGSVMGSSAVIAAAVYPNGASTTACVQWGTTASYGNSTAPQFVGSGVNAAWLRETLTGLQPGAMYHYRVVTTNANGVTYGPDQTFYVDSSVKIGDADGDGVVDQDELDTVLAGYWPTSPWLHMTNLLGLGRSNVTFALTNSTAGAYSVLMSSNLADWTYVGPATPRYEFIDTNAPASINRFYRLRWP